VPPVRSQLFAAAGFGLLCGCNDTSNLAPGAPDTPAQFRSSEDATTAASAAAAPGKFTIPPNTAVELPPTADIDASRVYTLVELIDIAQRRNPQPVWLGKKRDRRLSRSAWRKPHICQY
jgi:hypothetical protein